MVGSAYLPVAGGLFLGDDASSALTPNLRRIWISQDQRNTLRTRLQYQIVSRAWTAVALSYGSGLPVEFTGSREQAIATYGAQLVDQVDFTRGRLEPNLSVDASLGLTIWKSDRLSTNLQADVINVTNRLNLLNFAGLFSGNSVAPPRSCNIHIAATF
jgi:outer membrane receptor for Fe3+-dicitrate